MWTEYGQVKRYLRDNLNCGVWLNGWGAESEKETVPGSGGIDEEEELDSTSMSLYFPHL